MSRPEIREECRGKWRGILPLFGVPVPALSKRNCPCPKCGGTDRFDFTDLNGEGVYNCRQCGGGDGVALVRLMTGMSFIEAVAAIREKLPGIPVGATPKRVTSSERDKMVRKLWDASRPITDSDEVDRYLCGRGLRGPWPKALQFAPACPVSRDPAHKALPAMLARVSLPSGEPYTLHRTYLQHGRKAVIESPRRLMPGRLEAGSHIRLGGFRDELAIAEGIETALAVRRDFGVTCWSLISAGNLAQFQPPLGVRRLRIFADNDPKFGGQAAAYALAHRVACQPDPIEVTVELPPIVGTDWADQAVA